MERLTIRWESVPQDPQRIVYYVDDFAVGEDDNGFDKVLEAVRTYKNRGVTLKIGNAGSLGGGSLIDGLPFRERFNELAEAAGEDNLIYDF
jgi:hypothetical protein